MVCHQAVPSVETVHLALAANDIGQAARCLDMPLGVDLVRELENWPCCDHWDDGLLVASIPDTDGPVGIDPFLYRETPQRLHHTHFERELSLAVRWELQAHQSRIHHRAVALVIAGL